MERPSKTRKLDRFGKPSGIPKRSTSRAGVLPVKILSEFDPSRMTGGAKTEDLVASRLFSMKGQVCL